MINKMKNVKKIAYWGKTILLGTIIGLSLQFVSAWTEPSFTPPDDNLGAPLNTGTMGQAKEGGLLLNTAGAKNGLLIQFGNMGIGTLSPKTPAPNDKTGNVDVNDVYVRSTGKWISQISGGSLPDCKDGQYLKKKDGAWKCVDTWEPGKKHFFISAATYNGKMGGAEGMSDKCNKDANRIDGRKYAAVTAASWGVPGVEYFGVIPNASRCSDRVWSNGLDNCSNWTSDTGPYINRVGSGIPSVTHSCVPEPSGAYKTNGHGARTGIVKLNERGLSGGTIYDDCNNPSCCVSNPILCVEVVE